MNGNGRASSCTSAGRLTAPAELPPGFSELAPELEAELELQLRRRGVSNIVLCAISASIGVESTARDAFERGFNVTFATDAMTDRHAAAHDRALEYIFPRVGELGTTDEILAKL